MKLPFVFSGLVVLVSAGIDKSFHRKLSAGVVTVPFHRKLSTDVDISPNIARRGDTVNLAALNSFQDAGYFSQLGIGTPPQMLPFHIDTGSSDTWVKIKGGKPCRSTSTFCHRQFSPNSSSTFKVVDPKGFDIRYIDGTIIKGDYFTDTVTINDMITIERQKLGLVTNVAKSTGVMGLGMRTNAMFRSKYPTVIDNLVSHGYIDAPVFSLYLNSANESHGSFLFGGVDTKKYTGDLVTLPLEPDGTLETTKVTSYAVSLEGLAVDGISTSDVKYKAILDTGSTIVSLPDRLAKPIMEKFQVVPCRELHNTPFVDCSVATKGEAAETKFHFKFRGTTISVPLREMVLDVFPNLQEDLKTLEPYRKYTQNMERVCMFGISSFDSLRSSNSSSELVLLGDTFLRSAYVVFDLAAESVSMAQSLPQSKESNIFQLKAKSGLSASANVDVPPYTARGSSHTCLKDVARASSSDVVHISLTDVACALAFVAIVMATL